MNTTDPRTDLVRRALEVANGASDPLFAGAASLCRRVAKAAADYRAATEDLEGARRDVRTLENQVVGFAAQKQLLADMLLEHAVERGVADEAARAAVDTVVKEALAPPDLAAAPTGHEEKPDPPSMPNPFTRDAVRSS